MVVVGLVGVGLAGVRLVRIRLLGITLAVSRLGGVVVGLRLLVVLGRLALGRLTVSILKGDQSGEDREKPTY